MIHLQNGSVREIHPHARAEDLKDVKKVRVCPVLHYGMDQPERYVDVFRVAGVPVVNPERALARLGRFEADERFALRMAIATALAGENRGGQGRTAQAKQKGQLEKASTVYHPSV